MSGVPQIIIADEHARPPHLRMKPVWQSVRRSRIARLWMPTCCCSR